MRAIDVMVRDVVTVHRNITVGNRVVHLWGLVGSEAERKALLALAENVPGVSRVADEMISS
jgi:osmotically-inducible protein OsmY